MKRFLIIAPFLALTAIPATPGTPAAQSAPGAPIPVIYAAQAAAAPGAPPAASKNTAFGDGERLSFRVIYRAALIPSTELATATLSVTKLPSGDYDILGNGKTASFAKWIYDIDDDYGAVVDPLTLRPRTAHARLREGDYRYNYDMTFDWDSMKVHSIFGNLKRPLRNKTMRLTDRSFEIISMFYNMRNEDIASFRQGVAMPIDLVMEDTVQRINFYYLGQENVDLKKMGTYKAHKFKCQLLALGDKSNFYLWVSADANRIPLKVDSPVKVGSITALLNSYSGLRNAVESKVK